jgi:hypothetical protein
MRHVITGVERSDGSLQPPRWRALFWIALRQGWPLALSAGLDGLSTSRPWRRPAAKQWSQQGLSQKAHTFLELG